MLQDQVEYPRRAGFLASRWQRRVPLGLLFWRDVILVGSAINLAAAFAGLMALGFKAGLPVAMVITLSPLPYNVFLVAAVWRTADLTDATTAASFRFGAALWLVIALVI